MSLVVAGMRLGALLLGLAALAACGDDDSAPFATTGPVEGARPKPAGANAIDAGRANAAVRGDGGTEEVVTLLDASLDFDASLDAALRDAMPLPMIADAGVEPRAGAGGAGGSGGAGGTGGLGGEGGTGGFPSRP